MEILVIGSDSQRELQQKFGPLHHYKIVANHQDAEIPLKTCDVVFDFLVEKDVSGINIYRGHLGIVVFLDTTMTSLKQLNIVDDQTLFVGFCGMPTFLDREILEVTLLKEYHLIPLQNMCEKLNTKFAVVADQVGMVTPRIVCMIINEAYYTMEEGTATREDIDLAMKLGTNYPYGPFEWCERIGRKEVLRLLESVYRSTKDERYKACQLMF
jgi:3-hydroxybutyryl-CoA dehydrogenase